MSASRSASAVEKPSGLLAGFELGPRGLEFATLRVSLADLVRDRLNEGEEAFRFGQRVALRGRSR